MRGPTLARRAPPPACMRNLPSQDASMIAKRRYARSTKSQRGAGRQVCPDGSCARAICTALVGANGRLFQRRKLALPCLLLAAFGACLLPSCWLLLLLLAGLLLLLLAPLLLVLLLRLCLPPPLLRRRRRRLCCRDRLLAAASLPLARLGDPTLVFRLRCWRSGWPTLRSMRACHGLVFGDARGRVRGGSRQGRAGRGWRQRRSEISCRKQHGLFSRKATE